LLKKFRKKDTLEGVERQIYRVPAFLADQMKESQIVSIEIMDEILSKALGIHILEP
jgi:hypothetical protein